MRLTRSRAPFPLAFGARWNTATARPVAARSPPTIRDLAIYMSPREYSTGIRYVLVNGSFVVDDRKRAGALPGKVLVGPMTKTAASGG